MLQITREGDEITVHEAPVAQWFYSFAAGAMLGGVFFVGISLLTKIHVLAICAGTLVFAAAALLYHWDNPSTTVKINKQGKIVSVRKKSLVGYKFVIYNFDELADSIRVKEFQGFPKQYQIIIPLKNGEKIEVFTQSRISQREYAEIADSLNAYLFPAAKRISPKAAARNLNKKNV